MTATRSKPLLAVVLAAGKGTRMKSSKPKVLHAIGGRSMLGHVLTTAHAAGANSIAVVVGPDMDAVALEARRWAPDARPFVQVEQRGTADAVLAAREALAAHAGDVLVMFADTPLIRPRTIDRLVSALDSGADVAVLGFHAKDPTGYGRLVTDGVVADGVANLLAVREHKDASAAERAITFCNSGMIAFRTADLVSVLQAIGSDNAAREFYLPDAIAILRGSGRRGVAVAGQEDEMLGVNDRTHLAEAEGEFQTRARRAAMQGGATLIDPSSVWFSYDTRIGQDVLIEPNVMFGPGVVIGEGVVVRAHSHLEGATLDSGSEVGPYARLRPGAHIERGARIGNFVEVKNARFEAGAKANHLAYIGDARIGAKANIGAGTIFCNYDGFQKHHTDVGVGAFVGSNSALVAPVKIGDGAFVGSGSVITRDVAPDSLAVARAGQEERPGWATKFRALMGRRKARSE